MKDRDELDLSFELDAFDFDTDEDIPDVSPAGVTSQSEGHGAGANTKKRLVTKGITLKELVRISQS